MVNEVKVEHVLILAIAVFLLYHFVGRCNCFNGNGFRVGGQEDYEEDYEEFLRKKKEENEQKNWEEPQYAHITNMATLIQEECGIEKYQIAENYRQFSECHEDKMKIKKKNEICQEELEFKVREEQETANNVLKLTAMVGQLKQDLEECKSDRYKEEQETANNVLKISGKIKELETELEECRRKLKIKSQNLSMLLKQTGQM
tara:strand:+ start:1436 stop:2041 length:606 start_codon:yes stop_codon:yes gene_type:complete